MDYTIKLHVEVDPRTTSFSALEHAEAVGRELRVRIRHGILTDHEPRAIITGYEISVFVGDGNSQRGRVEG